MQVGKKGLVTTKISARISELLTLSMDPPGMMRTSHLKTWAPRALGVAIFVAMIAAVTWTLLGRAEMRKNKELLLYEANNARDLLIHDLNLRLATMRRIGWRLSANPTITEVEFRNEALSYLADVPGFFEMMWVDGSGHIQFVEPARGKMFIGTHLSEMGPGLLELVEQVGRISGPRIELVSPLNDGGQMGFVTALNVRAGGEFKGTLLVKTHAELWVENLLYGSGLGTYDDVALVVSLDGQTIYENDQFSVIEEQEVAGNAERLINSEIATVVKPTPEMVAKLKTGQPIILTVLVSILSLASLIAILALRDLRSHQKRIDSVNSRLRDTNRRMYEEIGQRREAEEHAKRSNATKMQFLSTMSHEFRTPVNGVLGMAELLSDAALPEPQATYVDNIRGSGKALMNIMSDLLDFSKFDAGEVDLHPVPCDVNTVVTEAVSLFQPMAEKKGINLSYEASLDASKYLQLDPARYRQIVLNLVRNAVKFTVEGSVFVRLTADSQAAIPKLILTVEDSGVGIPQEQLGRIFAAFQQVDGAKDREFEGTGLGLSIVHRLTKAMGGTVAVTSRLHQGSTFTVSIPAVTAPPTKQAQPSDETPQLAASIADARVLLAEDNAINQRIVSGYLKGTGVSLDLAANGEEAVDRYKAGAYDAILMDVSMPRMNGFDATKKIREIERADKRPVCPILGYTANFGADDQKNCRESGMDDVLGKPASKIELISRLAHWIETAKSGASGEIPSFSSRA